MLNFGYYNMDCIEGMKQFPDKYFDLAIVDPPYGDATNESCVIKARSSFGVKYKIDSSFKNEHGTHFRGKSKVHRTGGKCSAKYGDKIKHWDVAPPQEYFDELFRVSKNQIIWGGNYFGLPPTRCFLVWKKFIPENFSMAMCEYAWTSFYANAKCIEIAPQGNAKEKRFHPTQKPVKLYNWILTNFAKPGDKILDTHVGSASSLIAFHFGGFPYVGFEIDEDYYSMSKKRLESEQRQIGMFTKVEAANG